MSVPHHFTVDVEEFFQVSALESQVDRGSWDLIASRVEIGTRKLLELMADRNQRGTFFTLSWVAERAPDLVREIAALGHEVASHGTDHRKVTSLTRREFRESVHTSKAILEDLTGSAVYGYRAPSFSIVRGTEWALDVLVEEGYRYDSSLFPVRRPGYGFAGGRRDPYRLDTSAGPLDEIPPATVKLGPAVVPAGGGAYFRLLPYRLVSAALSAAERRGVPGTFYIHPWELDPGQPRLDVPFLTTVRHYGGLSKTAGRLNRLLSNFRFQPIATTLGLPLSGSAKEVLPPSSSQAFRGT